MSVAPTAARIRPGRRPAGRVGRSPSSLVAEGALGAVLGVLVLTWPGATAASSPGCSAIQLLVTGVLQLRLGASPMLAARPAAACCRACLGTMSLLVGLLCLRTHSRRCRCWGCSSASPGSSAA